MLIKKKIWPAAFDAILERKKKFELRLADFECKPGDTLLLEEWDPKLEHYTGRKIQKRVTYVLKTKDVTFWTQEDVEKYGFQILSLE